MGAIRSACEGALLSGTAIAVHVWNGNIMNDDGIRRTGFFFVTSVAADYLGRVLVRDLKPVRSTWVGRYEGSQFHLVLIEGQDIKSMTVRYKIAYVGTRFMFGTTSEDTKKRGQWVKYYCSLASPHLPSTKIEEAVSQRPGEFCRCNSISYHIPYLWSESIQCGCIRQVIGALPPSRFDAMQHHCGE